MGVDFVKADDIVAVLELDVYISNQYNKANCVGLQKSDRWEGVPELLQNLINLVYNGRPWLIAWEKNTKTVNDFKEQYLSKQKILDALWKEKGNDPEFYEKYYLPKQKN